MAVISNEVKGSIRLKYSEGLGPDGKEKFRYNNYSGLKPTISDALVYQFKKLLEEVQTDAVTEVNRQRVFELAEA